MRWLPLLVLVGISAPRAQSLLDVRPPHGRALELLTTPLYVPTAFSHPVFAPARLYGEDGYGIVVLDTWDQTGSAPFVLRYFTEEGGRWDERRVSFPSPSLGGLHASDFDRDGDEDLLIGRGAMVGLYRNGAPPALGTRPFPSRTRVAT